MSQEQSQSSPILGQGSPPSKRDILDKAISDYNDELIVRNNTDQGDAGVHDILLALAKDDKIKAIRAHKKILKDQ